MDPVFKEALDKAEGCPQSQESLYNQMIESIPLLRKFGLHDAADYIQKRIDESNALYYS